MKKKYKLILTDTIKVPKTYKLDKNGELIPFEFRTLYRIEALKNFGKVKKGDRGGYIEKYKNLSHYGKCWVFDNAKVYNKAKVFGDALICNNSQVSAEAQVFQKANILDSACIGNMAKVYGKAIVCEHSNVFFNAIVTDSARICGNASLSGSFIARRNTIIDSGVHIKNSFSPTERLVIELVKYNRIL